MFVEEIDSFYRDYVMGLRLRTLNSTLFSINWIFWLQNENVTIWPTERFFPSQGKCWTCPWHSLVFQIDDCLVGWIWKTVIDVFEQWCFGSLSIMTAPCESGFCFHVRRSELYQRLLRKGDDSTFTFVSWNASHGFTRCSEHSETELKFFWLLDTEENNVAWDLSGYFRASAIAPIQSPTLIGDRSYDCFCPIGTNWNSSSSIQCLCLYCS